MRRWRAWLLVLATSPAVAEPVLHEYVKPPRAGAGRIVGAPSEAAAAAQPEEQRRENPPAIRQDEKILVEPQSNEPARPSEVVHGESSFGADRQTEARPDYLTQADGTLHYSEPFNPSVVPFKRMSALDSVAADYTLGVRDRQPRPLPAHGDTSADRDLFWASLVVDLPAGGRPVAIPSVAPDMRILSHEVEPRTRLVFGKDGGDNFTVRAADPRTRGEHRVVFLADAPASYFAPRVPAGVTLRVAAAARPPARLPAPVARAAGVVLARIGVSPDDEIGPALDKLVAWFRAFEAGAPPDPSGDVYLDLALSQRGVCRHRAFAFMITANAAGLATRYVTNEAHAFAEVFLPETGWSRVDLGGAALELEVANASDKAMHRPRGADPFPKPREYAENYTRLRGPVPGLTSEQIAEAQSPPGAPAAPGDPTSTDPVRLGETSVPRPVSVDPGRRPLRLAVDSVDRRGFRGEMVKIAGRATDGDGDDLSLSEGLRVDLYLAPRGARGSGARVVGKTVTDRAGKFTVAVELPGDLLLGEHEVFAVTPGNDAFAPAVSD
jgi:hypothetical protein